MSKGAIICTPQLFLKPIKDIFIYTGRISL